MLKDFISKVAAAVKHLIDICLDRHYLLFDSDNSCVYIPRHTYRHLNKLLLKSLDNDPKAENSLRFLWSRVMESDNWVLSVNPLMVNLTSTHGLTTDSAKRVIIPCPYIQRIYHSLDLLPEWSGRIDLEKMESMGGNCLARFLLKGGKR